MSVVNGRVVDGRVVVEDFVLPEGAMVAVHIGDDESDLELSEDEEAELEAAMNDIRRGNYVTAEELFRRLRE